MKKVQVLAMFLAASLACAPAGFAQKKSKSTGASKTQGRADAELADLAAKLSLTDDQKAKIHTILTDETAKIHTIKMDKSVSADDKKAKTKPIREDAQKQIRAVLTPEQQKTWDTMPKDEKSGKEKKAAAPAAPGL